MDVKTISHAIAGGNGPEVGENVGLSRPCERYARPSTTHTTPAPGSFLQQRDAVQATNWMRAAAEQSLNQSKAALITPLVQGGSIGTAAGAQSFLFGCGPANVKHCRTMP